MTGSELGDVIINDLVASGLPVASTLRASKITTLDISRVIRRAGRLSEADRQLARRALMACAGI